MPVVVSSTNDYLELLNANAYEKGSLILHMLRKDLGDSTFWKCLRSFYNEFAGRNANTDDFRTTCEKVSGKDLKKFFQQWLYTPGHPRLDVIWNYNKATRSAELTIMQQQDTNFEFPLQLKVALANGQSILKTFQIKDKRSLHSISVESPPSSLELDPNADLFFEANLKKVTK